MASPPRPSFAAAAACALAAVACASGPGPRAPSGGPGSEDGASRSAPAGSSGRDPQGNASSERSEQDARDPARAPRALVFQASGFPTVDAPAVEPGVLDAALAGLAVTRAGSAAELTSRLNLRDVDVLVLPYGSAFPLDAWPRIQTFLRRGGGLVVLGGAPFSAPVRERSPGESGSGGGEARAGGGFEVGPREVAFAHALLLGPAEPVARPKDAKTVLARPPGGETGWRELTADATTTYALTLRLARNKDLPDEHGSAGPRDAIARPLVHVVDASGTPRGCALLEIDHHHGDAAGARWLLATSDAKLDAKIIRAMVTRALEGSSELAAQPARASVAPGEAASIRVTSRRFVARAPSAGGPPDEALTDARITVTDARGREVHRADVTLHGPPETRTALVPVGTKLGPGLYHVTVSPRRGDGRAGDRSDAPARARVTAETGFVVRDETLLTKGPRLEVSRDWLRKDAKVMPIVGTTYMASDVHRKFLFEPNPHVWDADFAAMKKHGINFVRTGLWTAWSRASLDPGSLDEGVLAALDAFVQTAARHGIFVCFNLFAFLPPTYTGENPYLDPRAIAGQRELLTQLAARFRGVPWVHWDLINEPSYAPRKDLWSTRAIGDAHEARAWRAWLTTRFGGDDALRALFRDPDDPTSAPRAEDFEQVAMQVGRRPRKARAFQEFKEEVVAGWAKTMRDVLRAAGGDVLVTLGQDEGGIYERPTQQLLAASLDYSAVHTWWKNDDLLWDGVLTKVASKPIIHQETGLMRLEDLDGAPWRTPEKAARLLERKLAYTFAGRGAGVVEWAWNVNPYMPIDEESTIGLFRPDGTAKPELDPMVELATFMGEAAKHLDDFEPDAIRLVIPHTRAFLGRTSAIDATKIAVRALAERFGVAPTAISDLRLTAQDLAGAKLVLVPAPDALDEGAARALVTASRAGAKILVTGPVEGDSYGREAPALATLGLRDPSRPSVPVAMHEPSAWSASGWVSFTGLLQESLRRDARPSTGKLATGNVWHEPLPLELARDPEPYVRMLDAALTEARVATSPAPWGMAARVLLTSRVALVVVVNERSTVGVRRVVVDGRSLDVPVAALGARMAIVERASGRTVVATPGATITAAGAPGP